MKAIFVGGRVDNSVIDLGKRATAPAEYPEGSGDRAAYRLHREARDGDQVAYAIYEAVGMNHGEAARIVAERAYERRFAPSGGNGRA